MEMKYFKPKSLTWWSGVIPICVGLIIATEPMHGMSSLIASINAATGGVSPAVMINAGLVAIGLRGRHG